MIKSILFLWRRSPLAVAAALALSILNGFSGVGLLTLINDALHAGPLFRATVVWRFAGLCLLLALSRCASEVILTRLAQDSLFEMQMNLARKIASAPLRFLEDYGISRLLGVLTQDIQVFTDALVWIPVTCMNLTTIAGCLIYLCWLSSTVFVIVFGFIVMCSLLYRFPASKATKYLQLARGESDSLYRHFSSLFEGAKELKLHQHRRRTFFSQVLQSSASSILNHNISGLIASIGAAAWVQVAGLVLIGTLILAIPLLRLNSPDRISYTIALIFMVAPLQALLEVVSGFKLAEVALERIGHLDHELTALHPEGDLAVNRNSECEFKCLDLIDVMYAYRRELETNNFIVGPVSLSLAPGEVVFLVGGNGAGKTTLAKLLVGLYEPMDGTIFLNDEIITNLNRERYRQYFSVVFADFHLFDGLLGLERSNRDGYIRNHLIQFELDDEVEVKDGVFSTTKLSQGQRRRLALLTAYLEDRPIYVFDECAADQDSAFKRMFYQRLLPEFKARGKAVLVISHDERYYSAADRIIRLDDGKLLTLPSVVQAV